MMKKLFLAVLLSCLAASASAFPPSGSPAPAGPVTTVLPTFNSTAAASANVAQIQAALNKGNKVAIICPQPGNSVFYTNAPAVIYSNTNLDVARGCTWTQAPSTSNNQIVNYAYTQSPTTLWNASGSITSGPLSLIWFGSLPYWYVSTAYSAGNYIVNSTGNLYWESATSCTSATTGSGPTGTGTGITDGTCSWNYVTGGVFGNTVGTSINAVVNWPNHGLTVGQSVLISPQPRTVSASQNVWDGTGSAGQLNGPCDSAYFGVFYVNAINDANHITITLRRLPAAGFTGIPINIKQADQNISITGGGTLDGNLSQQGFNYGALNLLSGNTIIMAGVQGLQVNIRGQHSPQSILYASGIANFDFAHVEGTPQWTDLSANGGQVIIIGPAFDGSIHDINGTGSDDIVALATGDYSHYNNIAQGDLIGVHTYDINTFGGFSVSIWTYDPNCLLDDVTVEHVRTHANGAPSIRAMPPVRFTGNVTGNSGHLGSVVLRDIAGRDDQAAVIDTQTAGSFTIDHLVIDHIQSVRNPSVVPNFGSDIINISPNTAGVTQTFNTIDILNPNAVISGYGGTIAGSFINIKPQTSTSSVSIGKLRIQGGRIYDTNTNTSAAVALYPTGPISISYLGIDGTTISSAQTATPLGTITVISASNTPTSTVAVDTVDLEHNVISNIGGIMVMHGQNQTLSHVIYKNNKLTNGSSGMVVYSAGTDYHFGDNTFASMSGGIIRYGAAVNDIIYSSGGNILSGGTIWFAYPSAGTNTVYGWDISCDVTKNTRTTGEFCFNTNTAPGSGTLNTAGLVEDQGTGSNSWVLLSNPTGQQY